MSQHLLQADKPHFCTDSKIQKFNQFLESPAFVLMIGFLTVVANLFRAEIIVYTIFVLLACYIVLFCNDFAPTCIIFLCCYITPSSGNNPGRAAKSIFYPQNGGIYLLILAVAFAGCVIYRLVTDRNLGGKNFLTKTRKFLPGMLILDAGYLLAGAFSGRYFAHGIMNLVFALLQVVSVTGLYWFFSGTIRWERIPKDYWAWIGFTVGITVSLELVGIYAFHHVIQNSKIQTALIYSGWGNANNIGCLIAMMVPFALFLSHRTNKIGLFSLAAFFMIACVFFTCSRTSILVAVPLYICTLIMVYRNSKNKKAYLKYNGIAALILLFLAILFHRSIGLMFQELLERGLNPRNRDRIYPQGIQAFLRNPIFGESFYPKSTTIDMWSTLPQMQSILPARWHNTVIQLLASCGLVGIACYSVHRIQTIRFFWQRRQKNLIFIGLSLLGLLLMSLLDCHFFNIGPTMFYSIMLAFAEFTKEEPLIS